MWITLTIILVALTAYVKWCYSYWKKRNIYTIKPSFPFGNTVNPFTRKRPFYEDFTEFYRHFKDQNLKHAGIYMMLTPRYVPIDPEIIKNIISKDFNHFMDRGIFYNEEADPLSAHLFAIGGTRWKNLRAKLTPTFTSGKMRNMFQTVLDCAGPMKDALYEMHKEPVAIKEIMACFTTDVIGSVAFGLECNSFKDTNAEFRKNGRKMVFLSTTGRIRLFCCFMFPTLAKKLGMSINEPAVADFFLNAVKNNVDYRKSNNVRRNDFMQILIDLADSEKSLTIEEIAAQAFVFFIAGFETSSTTMQFVLYELAQNQQIQEKVRNEINTVLEKFDGKLTYESANELKYLNQVVDETLRKYPPLAIINRVCTSRYQIPGSDLVLEEGDKVLIPAMGLHMDDEYFPDAKRFDPDRFSDENKHKIVPFTYLPFGDGPRICIGKRFGIMQSKVGLATILKNFKVSLNPKTPVPLTLDVNSLLLNCKGEIYLDLDPIP